VSFEEYNITKKNENKSVNIWDLSFLLS